MTSSAEHKGCWAIRVLFMSFLILICLSLKTDPAYSWIRDSAVPGGGPLVFLLDPSNMPAGLSRATVEAAWIRAMGTWTNDPDSSVTLLGLSFDDDPPALLRQANLPRFGLLGVSTQTAEGFVVVRSGAAPDAVLFLDPVTGAAVATFEAATSNPIANNSIAFKPDGSRAIVTGGAGTDSVQVFDLTGATPTLIARVDLSTAPLDVDITPDGRLAIVRAGAGPDAVLFLNPVTGTPVRPSKPQQMVPL